MKPNSFSPLVAGLIGLIIGVGATITFVTVSPLASTTGAQSEVDMSLFWDAWRVLDEKYVPASTTTKVTDNEKVWGAIAGLAASYGDPYTTFFPPEENAAFQEEISGNFEGVGMEVDIKDDTLTVVTPLKNSPAERAGVKPGDKIASINGTPSVGLSVEQAVKKIRGPQGTEVKLDIVRDGEQLELTLIRDVIQIPTIDTKILGSDGERVQKGVFVISLYNFSAVSAVEFRKALKEFIASGSDKLIIDLRGNPGGYLDAAVDMSSWFLPLGAPVVREDFGGNKEEGVYRSRGYSGWKKNPEIVVLINKGSASASEILAGALKDHGVATLVGDQSFGKGSVQELVPLRGGTSLKVTIARWLTPNGVSISGGGLTPDVVVKDDNKAEGDEQLLAALKVLFGE